jgi:DNA (cytosine-5)-methyltransferase 1
MTLNFIDLFSGAGGLSNGLEQAGLKCLLGVDMDKNAIETFRANHHHAETFCGSITELSQKKILELTKGETIHAIVGGPPCQGFSTVGIGDPKDQRNLLFKEFIRVVKILHPHFFIIENVTGLLAKKNEKTIQAIFKLFSSMGYNLDVKVMSAEDYGVPERRRRTIFIGSKINNAIHFPLPSHQKPITVGLALKNLKSKNGKIFNHDIEKALIKSELDRKRIGLIPEGKGIRYEADERNYLTKKLFLGIDWSKIPENRLRQTKYQRLDRKKPAPTIMTHRHNYFHPTENRYLTQREAAALQSFPNDFIFHGNLSAQWRQIGNAVPPLLGKVLGQTLLSLYKNQDKKTKLIIKKINQTNSARKSAFTYKKD